MVLTSPLLRTMQTAVGVFGDDQDYHHQVNRYGSSDDFNMYDGDDENIKSIVNNPPIVALEICRDRLVRIFHS